MTKLHRFCFAVSLIVLSFTACGSITPDGSQDFPTDLLLTAQDLPSGFVRKTFVAVDVPNADSLAVDYIVPDGSNFPPIKVSHQLAIYIDEQSSRTAYLTWEKETFSSDIWKVPDDFHFTPMASGDLYHFECSPGYFDGKYLTDCIYIQQHNNKISLIFANLDGNILKLEDVEKTLARLDARLSQAK